MKKLVVMVIFSLLAFNSFSADLEPCERDKNGICVNSDANEAQDANCKDLPKIVDKQPKIGKDVAGEVKVKPVQGSDTTGAGGESNN